MAQQGFDKWQALSSLAGKQNLWKKNALSDLDESFLETRNSGQLSLNTFNFKDWRNLSPAKLSIIFKSALLSPSFAAFSPLCPKARVLDHFGLKNQKEWLNSLQSPEGKKIQTLLRARIEEDFFHKEAMKNEIFIEEKQKKLQRLAYLLLGLRYRRRMRKRYELINEELERLLQAGELKLRKDELALREARKLMLEEAYHSYHLSCDALFHLLEEKKIELQLVDLEIEKLNKVWKGLEEQYATYEKALEKLTKTELLLETPHLSTEEKIDKVEKKIKKLDKKKPKPSPSQAAAQEKETLKYDEQADELRRLGLNDLLDVLKGFKMYFNSEGKPVYFPTEAVFLIPSQKKIIKYEDQYYIIKQGQHFENLSLEEKISAHQNYENEKLSLMPLKARLQYQKSMDLKICAKQRYAFFEEKERLNKEKAFVEQQLNEVQASLLQVSQLLNQEENFCIDPKFEQKFSEREAQAFSVIASTRIQAVYARIPEQENAKDLAETRDPNSREVLSSLQALPRPQPGLAKTIQTPASSPVFRSNAAQPAPASNALNGMNNQLSLAEQLGLQELAPYQPPAYTNGSPEDRARAMQGLKPAPEQRTIQRKPAALQRM